MTAVEHRILTLALAWILASVPLALLVWQVWLRPRPVHPVIPHEDDGPAGSFLDVVLPPPLPEPAESGIPVRHWRQVDGWVALAVVVVLSVLMGPLAPGTETVIPLSPGRVAVQLGFQLSMGGLLLFYLTSGRGFDPARLFGLRRHPWWKVTGWALAWIVPGTMVVGLLAGLAMPYLLDWLGQDKASPQPMVTALQATPDALTGILVAVSIGIGAPFMEELIFRGFLYSIAKRFTHWSYAALGSSLFFAMVHANVMSFLPLTLLGLLFTAAYEQSKNLLVPMVMHGTFNLCQLAIMIYAPQLAQQLEQA